MKTFAKLLAVLAIVGLVSVVEAAKGDKKPAGVQGKVVKIDGDKIVITKRDKTEATIETDANTKVTIDGKDGKVAEIQPGMLVQATPETGKAEKVMAKTATKPAKK